eukprot:TRINITY_DN39790_c0_g1_i1.p1 TRINITY_DN39790_c0_g1~~TRINITY_DN39790_c0_g1_i1.p1  ORF type:complete len:394 (+),score=21.91 TRINITY_DN39790_c0_g1_i1:95-1183(+)
MSKEKPLRKSVKIDPSGPRNLLCRASAVPTPSIIENTSICDVIRRKNLDSCSIPPHVLTHTLKCPSKNRPLTTCTSSLTLSKPLSLGGKTALYKGTFKGAPVGVKQYPLKLYKTFEGFQFFTGLTSVRHPFINYPTAACYHPESDTVLQTQKFLKGKDLRNWRKTEDRKTIGDGTVIEWALRVACIHEFLHGHEEGPFTYDDNHPGQYFITEDGPVLIDIDTIQKADPNGHTTCRCFGCNGGRANCQFLNSPEGYQFCSSHPTTSCTTKTDIWFLGQVLLSLHPHGTLTPSSSLLKQGASSIINPKIPKDYAAVIEGCLALDPEARFTSSEVVSRLASLCASLEGCAFDGCPEPSVGVYHDI